MIQFFLSIKKQRQSRTWANSIFRQPLIWNFRLHFSFWRFCLETRSNLGCLHCSWHWQISGTNRTNEENSTSYTNQWRDWILRDFANNHYCSPFSFKSFFFFFFDKTQKISFTTESVFPFFYNLMMSRHKYYATPRQILIALKRRPQTAIKDFRQEGPVALDCSSISISFLLDAFLPLFSIDKETIV